MTIREGPEGQERGYGWGDRLAFRKKLNFRSIFDVVVRHERGWLLSRDGDSESNAQLVAQGIAIRRKYNDVGVGSGSEYGGQDHHASACLGRDNLRIRKVEDGHLEIRRDDGNRICQEPGRK